MKYTELCAVMSREKIEYYCKKKGWRLPTFEEAEIISKTSTYKNFWIDGYQDSLDTETNIIEKRPSLFFHGKSISCSPYFKENVIIFKNLSLFKRLYVKLF